MPTKDGGQAFPVPYVAGMALRDWFASQVAPALITYHAKYLDQQDTLGPGWIASDAYAIADAMIKAREGAK